MRVIAGTAKGRTLQSVPGDSTRPITDRVKSALFSILLAQDMIEGRRYLDLFAGTGAVGIEALSRGAGSALFCERDRAALRTWGTTWKLPGWPSAPRSYPAMPLLTWPAPPRRHST